MLQDGLHDGVAEGLRERGAGGVFHGIPDLDEPEAIAKLLQRQTIPAELDAEQVEEAVEPRCGREPVLRQGAEERDTARDDPTHRLALVDLEIKAEISPSESPERVKADQASLIAAWVDPEKPRRDIDLQIRPRRGSGVNVWFHAGVRARHVLSPCRRAMFLMASAAVMPGSWRR